MEELQTVKAPTRSHACQVCCVASMSLATFGCNNTALGCALVRVALQGQTITAAPVLQALMAFSSLHRYGLQSQALELKVAALGSLAKEPGAPSLGVEATLQHAATGMLLCSFEIHQSSCTSGHWPFYLHGVKAVFGACSVKMLHQLGPDVAVLLDWVNYHDVLARFSLLHWRKGGSPDLPPTPTDLFCSQVSNLPPPIFCMLDLLSQVCDAVSGSAILLETSGGVGDYKSFLEVLDWRIRSLSIPKIPDDENDASDDTTLVMQLYQLAILLFLDRCFEDLIDQPVRTQQYIDKAFAILPRLSFCKQQFPIHVIGCEARTDEQRAAVLDVISRTEKMSLSRL
ncbi:conserved hypothetical protein [Verticillium alfalfae VaMs.102]|uniref:C6 zinc finger domain-containing protein n=1 Tax=Verticillium alfalfae (strain VaMs.102 / ATCC MYA-4576 / FGSC 10136) TaxID=526221 RepID=C9SPE2_VERA1|nr:conserved hypothetical protein [Verticillium alfalfae VaMs.102]EEY20657.1 conserved hypothetical protein [Verticillium alfalfae VaMs.102]